MRWSAPIALFFFVFVGDAYAELRTRIIDTGPGFASATIFPNGDVMVFDTGHWTYQNRVFDDFQEFIGNRDITLLIVSHSDADHLSATDDLFQVFRVHKVIRTGYERPGKTNWENHRDAIVEAAEAGLTHDINLANVRLPHGTSYSFGSATVTILSGFHEPPAQWGLTGSEHRNGNSIVARVEYKGRSILFTGDAVGRHEGAPADAPALATERYLIDHASTRPIASNVLLAPHHGSDDASSSEFIKAVGAQWVIFSAGHQYGHPRKVTAKRYLDLGYEAKCLLRTDRGDHEGDSQWNPDGSVGTDPVGDDDIEITIASNGKMAVRYLGGESIACGDVNNNAVVKKSNSGICHTTESPWFERTKHFTTFDDLETCIESGGRPVNQ